MAQKREGGKGIFGLHMTRRKHKQRVKRSRRLNMKRVVINDIVRHHNVEQFTLQGRSQHRLKCWDYPGWDC